MRIVSLFFFGDGAAASLDQKKTQRTNNHLANVHVEITVITVGEPCGIHLFSAA